MRSEILYVTGNTSISSVHAYFATRKAHYIDLKTAVITSPETYIGKIISGLSDDLQSEGDTHYKRFYERIFSSKSAMAYMYLFHKRTFWRNYDHHAKIKPLQTSYWIGSNKETYGIFISPRFKDGQWENDKSEIRKFKPKYWSIGHILATGLVMSGKSEQIKFSDLKEFLNFYRNKLVRPSMSQYQIEIADLYSEYVIKSKNPNDILLLIPELRYGGEQKKHGYRLDYCIIDIETANKIGFEFSPWSTHGRLTGTKDKSQAQINELASSHYAKEMKKYRDYCLDHGITCITYTDEELRDITAIFQTIKKYLHPSETANNLKEHTLSLMSSNFIVQPTSSL